MREREGEGRQEGNRQTDRKTDRERQTERETDRQRDRQTERQTDEVTLYLLHCKSTANWTIKYFIKCMHQYSDMVIF